MVTRYLMTQTRRQLWCPSTFPCHFQVDGIYLQLKFTKRLYFLTSFSFFCREPRTRLNFDLRIKNLVCSSLAHRGLDESLIFCVTQHTTLNIINITIKKLRGSAWMRKERCWTLIIFSGGGIIMLSDLMPVTFLQKSLLL